MTQESIDSTICVPGWTKTVRPPTSFTTALKQEQLESGYAYGGDFDPSDYYEDHLIPLQLGGSPTSVLNLWPEPRESALGYDLKARVETELKAQVCAGSISLAVAQEAIASDWYSAYQTYVANPLASLETSTPPTTTLLTSPTTSRAGSAQLAG